MKLKKNDNMIMKSGLHFLKVQYYKNNKSDKK